MDICNKGGDPNGCAPVAIAVITSGLEEGRIGSVPYAKASGGTSITGLDVNLKPEI